MDGEREWARTFFHLVWNWLLVPVNDEAHLNEGYSYDQSSFRGRFVEGVNGDDFGINFINKTINIFALQQAKTKDFQSKRPGCGIYVVPGIYVNWISLATGLIFFCRSWYLKHTTFPFRVAASNSCSPAWHSPYILLCEGKRLKLSSTNGHRPFTSGNILQMITKEIKQFLWILLLTATIATKNNNIRVWAGCE